MATKTDLLIREIDNYLNNTNFFKQSDISYQLKKLYYFNPAKTQSEKASRASLFSAYKKVLKREIVEYIANRCVEHFNIKETTISFFSEFCEEVMGRKVDNRFIIDKFANRIKKYGEFIKLDKKRSRNSTKELEYSAKEMIELSMYKNTRHNVSVVNFKNLYEHICDQLQSYFEQEKKSRLSNKNYITEEDKFRFKSEKEKEKLIEDTKINIVNEEETVTKKRKRL